MLSLKKNAAVETKSTFKASGETNVEKLYCSKRFKKTRKDDKDRYEKQYEHLAHSFQVIFLQIIFFFIAWYTVDKSHR